MKVFVLLAMFAYSAWISAAEGQWQPVKDISLLIEPGSILDFSNLVPQPSADKRLLVAQQGYWATQDNPSQPKRFLIAALGFGTATGGFPDHSMATLYARQLRMHGYNMARLDFVEDTLMSGRQKDFDVDPDKLDRFYYLLAALKREGIYYVLNGLSSDNAGYGNVQERWVSKHDAKLRVYYDKEVQAHWKKLMEKMLASKNPYTDQTTLQDTTLAGVIMVNEGGLAFVTRNGVPDALRPQFADWLKVKYGSTAALAKAWKGELRAGESIEAKSVAFPTPKQWTGTRMADTQRFFVALEKTTSDWMIQYLRQLGYKGMLTAYDNWLSPAAHASRGQFDWVDLHNYFFEPTLFTQPGSVMRQDSALQDGVKYIRELASGRHLGKAYTVTEFGQVFWNQYRRESALAVPAYAAFQGWDAICQHSGAIDLSYAAPGGRKDAIYPFVVGFDPIARATDTLAALLYLRGDVAPAKHMVSVKLSEDYVFNQSAFLGNMPADISRLALVTGLGLDWKNRVPTNAYDAAVEPGNSAFKLTGKPTSDANPSSLSFAEKVDGLAQQYAGKLGPKISKTPFVVDQRWASRVSAMQKTGLISANNLTNAESGIYQSDTGQIVLNSQQKSLTVMTPNTEAVVFDALTPIRLNHLAVEQADAPALISVSSMDGQPLQASKRMLLIVATDARNSDMRFMDAAETTLKDLGKKPVLMRVAKFKLNLKNKHAATLKLFSTTLRGQRGDAIPVAQDADGVTLVLDTAKLKHGPTTYFELVSQELL